MKTEIKEVTLQQQNIKVIINRKNNKNTYIKVVDGNIIVNTNKYVSQSDIERLIHQNQHKILKIINKQIGQKLNSNQIRYLGKIYQLVLTSGNKLEIQKTSNAFYVTSKYDYEKTVDLIYKKEAENVLPKLLSECLTEFNKYYRKTPPKLIIRKMTRRYGTCYYTKDQICLNSHLMKYDVDVIKYVIYHELVHFIHHDHSKNFYASLQLVCPNYKELKKKLNNF